LNLIPNRFGEALLKRIGARHADAHVRGRVGLEKLLKREEVDRWEGVESD